MTGKDDWDKLSGQEQSNVQVGVTDMTSRISEVMHDAFGFGRVRAPGQKSNFEDHDLNDMIDIVENTNPADLEGAGEALWKAQKAISDAATELRGHLTAAEDDWKGEAGKAFQIWGKGLAGHADALADYAKAAGVQITSAGTGLASVRSAMPPRDSRLVRKSVADIPVVARVETNDEYTAATKVEGHRQEAINQMNRLSSYYVVSEESLKGLEPPTFEAMPNVGVPKPSGRGSAPTDWSGDETSGTTQRHAAVTEGVVAHERTIAPPTDVATTPVKEVHGEVTLPDRPVGTEINSVDTLPQRTPTPVTSTTTPTTTPTTGPPGVPLPSYAQGMPTPLGKGPVGRALGTTGMPRNPTTAQGRPGTTGPATARGLGQGGTNPMGRPNATGQPGGKGGMPGGRPTSGVTGGTPRQAGTSAGRQGLGPRGAGRSSGGVIGGRPTSTGASAKSGPKVPRGKVIGGEGAAGSRTSSGGISQRGVMGAPSTTNGTARNQAPGRGVIGNSDGVTGAPAGRNSASRAGRNGFTTGGSGLVRGPEGRGGSDQKEGEGAQRPDCLAEDEQTHLPKKPQRDVPPVID
ncbi:WXG100 family type VII secretion target [Streptomyces sp. NPDC058385]|uniref:WXG100 family type VII secretion target n=1 Tax=Streptomyces sp. NPDC058385 TaxID=3346473 RepID=UPI003665007E